ncbi:MAG: glutamate-cysteine ligase family protein [Methanopyri archaeon]|jgi:hypothetical protein|nr:glutamate-cysteine ligase family protein [Methanopyri archaeon]
MLAPTFNDGHSVGLEKEFYVVNGHGGKSRGYEIIPAVEERMREEMGVYDSVVGPKAYNDPTGPVEVTTRPCTDLQQLTDDVTTAYTIAQEEAEARGWYALGMGTRPGKAYDMAGLHVHIGFADKEEARYVFHALQSHVPDIMALSTNSPSNDGTVKDMRMSARGLDGLFMIRFGHQFDPFEDTTRYSVVYVRENTLELRCMDTQGSAVEDAAIAAYILGIAEKAKADHAKSVPMTEVQEDASDNFQRAIEDGMTAIFTNGATEVPAHQVVADTLAEVRPYLEQYNCPESVIAALDDKVENKRSGADDILDIYKEMKPEGFKERVSAFFHPWRTKERLIDRLAHRDNGVCQENGRDS